MAKKELVHIYCENCGEKMLVGRSTEKDKDGEIKKRVDNFVGNHKGHKIKMIGYSV